MLITKPKLEIKKFSYLSNSTVICRMLLAYRFLFESYRGTNLKFRGSSHYYALHPMQS